MALSKVSISRNRFIVLLLTGLVLLTVALLVGYPHFSGERGFLVPSVLEKLHGDSSGSETHSDVAEKVPVDTPTKVHHDPPAEIHDDAPSETPGNATARLRVVAMVFYGRRDRVSILDCYLQVR